MIAHLSGNVIFARTGFVILETGGVGYKVIVSHTKSYKEGEGKRFFIHEHIREESDDLYGFESFEELELFQNLISVNGVGPKVAMTIMTVGPVEKIMSAIGSQDESFFQTVPGIGKKVAAKIIIELKNKYASGNNYCMEGADDSDELVAALLSLGYKNNEIQKISCKIPAEETKIEDKIKWCLRNIAT